MSKHPVDVHVGKRLKERRQALGISQATLGHIVGVSFQQVQKYERGINRISAATLHDFAKALGVSISYFFEGIQESAFQFLPMDMLTSWHDTPDKEMRLLVKYWFAIENPESRKKLLALMKAISRSGEEDEEEEELS